MISGVHSCGVPLDAIKSYSKVLSSDVPYEGDLDVMRPSYPVISMPRATLVQTSDGRDLAARSRRIITRLFTAQSGDDRHAIFYGRVASVGLRGVRWSPCRQGPAPDALSLVQSGSSGLGFRSVVRICSIMKLWDGPSSESARCFCESRGL